MSLASLRFMDEIDATRTGSEWLEQIARFVNRERPCNIETHRFSPSDGGVTLLWAGNWLVASFMIVRDERNYSVLVRWRNK